MSILLPLIVFDQPANLLRSYYKNLAGGTTAEVVVTNTSAYPLQAVFTTIDAPVLTYTVPANESFGLGLQKLLVIAIQSSDAGAVQGDIDMTIADF